ncbi:MAG: hypothetical protein V1495_00030 [Pseudomonadota bacterium]
MRFVTFLALVSSVVPLGYGQTNDRSSLCNNSKYSSKVCYVIDVGNGKLRNPCLIARNSDELDSLYRSVSAATGTESYTAEAAIKTLNEKRINLGLPSVDRSDFKNEDIAFLAISLKTRPNLTPIVLYKFDSENGMVRAAVTIPEIPDVGQRNPQSMPTDRFWIVALQKAFFDQLKVESWNQAKVQLELRDKDPIACKSPLTLKSK